MRSSLALRSRSPLASGGLSPAPPSASGAGAPPAPEPVESSRPRSTPASTSVVAGGATDAGSSSTTGLGDRRPSGNGATTIVVTFASPQRAVGFDYPGNVQAVWRRPDGGVIVDTGDIPGSGDNFVGLAADQAVGSVTLVRQGVNEISGLAFAACK